MNQTALITGASTGIGYELAKLFAKDGFNLVITARNEAKLNEVKKELNGISDIKVHVIAKDLSEPQAAAELFNEITKQSINIDIVVNNAGYGLFGLFSETDWNTELRMIQLNITSLTQLTKLFLPEMIKRNEGKILNVASTAGFMPGPLMAVYYATKAYVLSFSQALSNELKDSAITVNTLCPGPTESEFSKTARLDNSKLFTNGIMRVLNAKTVAQISYRDLMKGKRLTITGLTNKIMIQSLRTAPRNMITNITRWIMSQRDSAI